MPSGNIPTSKESKSVINAYTVIAFLSIVVSIALLLLHFIEGQQFVALVIASVMLSIAVKVLPQLEEISIPGYKIRLQTKISEAEELIKRLDDLDFQTNVLELNAKMRGGGYASTFLDNRPDVLMAYREQLEVGNISDKFKRHLLKTSIMVRDNMFQHLKDNSDSSSENLQELKSLALEKKGPQLENQISKYVSDINKLDNLCNFIKEKLTAA
jgi:hypothetical protein